MCPGLQVLRCFVCCVHMPKCCSDCRHQGQLTKSRTHWCRLRNMRRTYRDHCWQMCRSQVLICLCQITVLPAHTARLCRILYAHVASVWHIANASLAIVLKTGCCQHTVWGLVTAAACVRRWWSVHNMLVSVVLTWCETMCDWPFWFTSGRCSVVGLAVLAFIIRYDSPPNGEHCSCICQIIPYDPGSALSNSSAVAHCPANIFC